MNSSRSNHNRLCLYCLTAKKGGCRCGSCGQETIIISKKARVPKKGAKKKEWVELFNTFPYILLVAPRTKSLVNLGIQK